MRYTQGIRPTPGFARTKINTLVSYLFYRAVHVVRWDSIAVMVGRAGPLYLQRPVSPLTATRDAFRCHHPFFVKTR